MSLLSATHLSKSFGPIDLFSDISFDIPYRARIAIVGPNGIGKTTLLRILIGEDSASAGAVSQARAIQTGYLPQEAAFQSVHTLWEECLSAFEDLRLMETELTRLEAVMSSADQAEEALARYGTLQAEFERQGGYLYLTRIRQVLTGLGFTQDEFDFPLDHLSGGQRTRALLARLLLSNPDLLILDEPTNHLDIAAVEWLEGYLSQWEGATLIVSHDRYFLDQVVDHIWEMSRSGFEIYRGNYSAYLMQRQERWERRQEVFESEKERLEKELDYIKRNISGQNVTQAKGRLRRLSRYLQAVDQLGLDAVVGRKWGEVSQEATTTVSVMSVDEAHRRIKALRSPSNRPLQLSLKLKTEQRSGELVLRTRDLCIGYPNNKLFCAQDIELRRLECAAIIGPNGAGKTTFLKTILEKLPPLEGEIILGASLDVGYFAQAHEDLNLENTLVQEIDSIAPHLLEAEIRDYLARFLFSGEEVYKKISVLSGGERGRLALAKLALSHANLLLLDEPTNHLDIPAQEVLQQVLSEFQGTILLVSHDRYLIDALASQIWEIDEEAQTLTVYKGSYSEYRIQKEAELAAESQETETRSRKEEYLSRQRKDRRAIQVERRRQAHLQDVEDRVAHLEQELAAISRRLENPPNEPGEVQQLGSDYVRVQKELENLLEEWEHLHTSG